MVEVPCGSPRGWLARFQGCKGGLSLRRSPHLLRRLQLLYHARFLDRPKTQIEDLVRNLTLSCWERPRRDIPPRGRRLGAGVGERERGQSIFGRLRLAATSMPESGSPKSALCAWDGEGRGESRLIKGVFRVGRAGRAKKCEDEESRLHIRARVGYP